MSLLGARRHVFMVGGACALHNVAALESSVSLLEQDFNGLITHDTRRVLHQKMEVRESARRTKWEEREVDDEKATPKFAGASRV